MATSSRSNQTLDKCNIPEEHNFFKEVKASKVGEEEEEEEEWLKLGLGLLGSDTSCRKLEGHGSNPVSHFPSQSSPSSQALVVSSSHETGLGLGSERGSGLRPKVNNEGMGRGVVMNPCSDYHNCNSLLDHCNYHHYYNHYNDDNGLVLWPSCQIDSHRNLAKPVLGGSNHYCARSPHHPGLWFTLQSSTNR
ncbi:hypothetical protein RIF29_10788 [Crotalaria pallida]|uniref:Uncharacterized protein n=1 Tax=Crotalaria pallida TaxID=3830 RepID=A0AAN9IKV8_CROPI